MSKENLQYVMIALLLINIFIYVYSMRQKRDSYDGK